MFDEFMLCNQTLHVFPGTVGSTRNLRARPAPLGNNPRQNRGVNLNVMGCATSYLMASACVSTIIVCSFFCLFRLLIGLDLDPGTGPKTCYTRSIPPSLHGHSHTLIIPARPSSPDSRMDCARRSNLRSNKSRWLSESCCSQCSLGRPNRRLGIPVPQANCPPADRCRTTRDQPPVNTTARMETARPNLKCSGCMARWWPVRSATRKRSCPGASLCKSESESPSPPVC